MREKIGVVIEVDTEEEAATEAEVKEVDFKDVNGNHLHRHLLQMICKVLLIQFLLVV